MFFSLGFVDFREPANFSGRSRGQSRDRERKVGWYPSRFPRFESIAIASRRLVSWSLDKVYDEAGSGENERKVEKLRAILIIALVESLQHQLGARSMATNIMEPT